MEVDDEIVVRRVREQARVSSRDSSSGQRREYRSQSVSEYSSVFLSNITPDVLGIGDNLTPMHDARFDASREPGETVADLAWHVLIRVDRKRPRVVLSSEGFRFHPENCLTFNFER